MFIRHISLALLLVPAVLAASGMPGAPADRKSGELAESIEKLIEQLGDDSPKVREAATRKLMERDDAVPALKKALESPDAEVKNRAKIIIAAIENRLRDRGVQQILDKGLDLHIDELVARGKEVKDEEWQRIVDLTRALADKAGWKPKGQANPFALEEDFRTCELVYVDDFKGQTCARKRLLANRATGPTDVGVSFVVCRGPVQGIRGITWSIVLANGNITKSDTSGSLWSSIVFCDGNVDVNLISDSLVLATGNVKGGRNDEHCVVIQGEPNVRKLLNLFNPAEAGLEVADSKTEVKVEKVHENKPFAKAGFQKGDLVLAVGDKEIKGYGDFRKAVRRNFVDKTEPVFKVKRGEQTLELKVSFKE